LLYLGEYVVVVQVYLNRVNDMRHAMPERKEAQRSKMVVTCPKRLRSIRRSSH
jgi:hypothetical protein